MHRNCLCGTHGASQSGGTAPQEQQEGVSPRDLRDKPLLISRQVDNKSGLHRWLRKESSELQTIAAYNLLYNASLMMEEGMGYAFALDRLVNTTGSNLCSGLSSQGWSWDIPCLEKSKK